MLDAAITQLMIILLALFIIYVVVGTVGYFILCVIELIQETKNKRR